MHLTDTRFKNLWFYLSHAEFNLIARKLKFRFWSDTCSYCLRRDLTLPFTPPDAQLSLTIRPLAQHDMQTLFVDRPELSDEDRRELFARLSHARAAIPTCYLAVTERDVPTYMQWLMGQSVNDRIQAYFNGTFPILKIDEALLENAFTLPEFRGKGIMAAAMARIAECARGIGARYVITFVEENNIPSLKGCKKSGFVPYMIRKERWRLFSRKLSFDLLPENTPYPFDMPATRPLLVEKFESMLHPKGLR